MSIAHEPIFIWLMEYAYQPNLVYLAMIGMMLISSVGFPLPEEVTFISVGILAFMGANPQLFPPPYPGAPVVNPTEAALIAFLAVVMSDLFIYTIGRIWGRRILYHPKLKRFFSPDILAKVEKWTQKYGAYACGIFRFTPGIRFPGHLACGVLKYPVWKFVLIDGFAAAISVPTQILLIAHYGEPILEKLRQFKVVFFGVLLVLIVGFIALKLKQKWRRTANNTNL